MALAIAAAPLSFFDRSVAVVSLVLLAASVLCSLPLVVRAFRKSLRLGLLAPWFVLMGNVAFVAGAIFGLTLKRKGAKAVREGVVISFVAALGISLAVTPVVRYIATRKQWVAHSPRPNATHPAMLGGLAVLASMLGAVVLAADRPTFASLLPFWAGLAVVFAMGLWDDFAALSPRVKLSIQVLAVSLFLSLLALEGKHPLSLWTPLFFFWLLGITNAFNLLDNMDGLTPGVGAIAAVGLAFFQSRVWSDGGQVSGVFSFSSGDLSSPALILLTLAGALVGFLVYNFPPAKIFLGDAGSHLVGFSLAALPFYSVSSNPGYRWKELILPPLILLVPICDTTYVTLARLARGSSPFQGGKDHLSHRLLAQGLSEKKIAMIFYSSAALVLLLAALLSKYLP